MTATLVMGEDLKTRKPVGFGCNDAFSFVVTWLAGQPHACEYDLDYHQFSRLGIAMLFGGIAKLNHALHDFMNFKATLLILVNT